MVGHDFSVCAEEALTVAVDDMAGVGGRLVLVHAYREVNQGLGYELFSASGAFKTLDDVHKAIEEVAAAGRSEPAPMAAR